MSLKRLQLGYFYFGQFLSITNKQLPYFLAKKEKKKKEVKILNYIYFPKFDNIDPQGVCQPKDKRIYYELRM